jgi:hypothetical protein
VIPEISMSLSLRLLAPLCAGLLLLAGCGGGGDGTAPPTGPVTPAPPVVTLSAAAGSSAHITVTWRAGSAGQTWRLERRAGDAAAFTTVADVDSGAGLWMDSGLGADTAYHYRLTRADGSAAATADARTGRDAALVTPAPQPAGDAVQLPFTPDTRRIAAVDGAAVLALPAGAFSQAGVATVQPVSNPLPGGVGRGVALTVPERPSQPLQLSLRLGTEETLDDLTQDRLAVQQADGSWWLLPLSSRGEGERVLTVDLPVSLWPQAATAQALQARGAAVPAPQPRLNIVRVKAHKLLPAAASVRVLGSQRFVPVAIYTVRDNVACDSPADGDLCIPMPVLRDVTMPVRNTKAGYQRQWELQGSATPDAALGTLAVEPGHGVVYTAPAQVPATNPLTLRFTSVHVASGRRLVLTAPVRVVEDAWVGELRASIGDLLAGHVFRLNTRWSLDAGQSTGTRRVYRPSGDAAHIYTMTDPVCTHSVSPQQLPLSQADTMGELVVDESVTPARYTLSLSTRWDSVLTVRCPRGSTSSPTLGGYVWAAQGAVDAGRIQGTDGLTGGERHWSLARPQ